LHWNFFLTEHEQQFSQTSRSRRGFTVAYIAFDGTDYKRVCFRVIWGKDSFQTLDFARIAGLSSKHQVSDIAVHYNETWRRGKNLSAGPMCFYDTNGPRISIRFVEQSKQVNLGLTMRMCNRMRIAALIYHYVLDDSVNTIIFGDSIGQSFKNKQNTPFSSAITVSCCIEGFAASG
jgi:hypothetical protein